MNITTVLMVTTLFLVVLGITCSTVAMLTSSKPVSSTLGTTSASVPPIEYQELQNSSNKTDEPVENQDADMNVSGNSILSLDDEDDNEDSRYMAVDGDMDDMNNMKLPEFMVCECDVLSLDVSVDVPVTGEDANYDAYNAQ